MPNAIVLSGLRVKNATAPAITIAATRADNGQRLALEGGGIETDGLGTLLVTEVQWPGGKAMAASQAAAGRSLAGKRFT